MVFGGSSEWPTCQTRRDGHKSRLLRCGPCFTPIQQDSIVWELFTLRISTVEQRKKPAATLHYRVGRFLISLRYLTVMFACETTLTSGWLFQCQKAQGTKLVHDYSLTWISWTWRIGLEFRFGWISFWWKFVLFGQITINSLFHCDLSPKPSMLSTVNTQQF